MGMNETVRSELASLIYLFGGSTERIRDYVPDSIWTRGMYEEEVTSPIKVLLASLALVIDEVIEGWARNVARGDSDGKLALLDEMSGFVTWHIIPMPDWEINRDCSLSRRQLTGLAILGRLCNIAIGEGVVPSDRRLTGSLGFDHFLARHRERYGGR